MAREHLAAGEMIASGRIPISMYLWEAFHCKGNDSRRLPAGAAVVWQSCSQTISVEVSMSQEPEYPDGTDIILFLTMEKH